jgi:hypothetical protein
MNAYDIMSNEIRQAQNDKYWLFPLMYVFSVIVTERWFPRAR